MVFAVHNNEERYVMENSKPWPAANLPKLRVLLPPWWPDALALLVSGRVT
jgi:hypothetical protein